MTKVGNPTYRLSEVRSFVKLIAGFERENNCLKRNLKKGKPSGVLIRHIVGTPEKALIRIIFGKRTRGTKKPERIMSWML